MKPYYDQDGITIFHGDCLDILPSVSADIVITDPPYNVGKKYGQHDDDMTADGYSDWIDAWWALLSTKRRIVFPGVGNLSSWAKREPVATACWYKPGATGRANPFQWCEWEPILTWGVMFSGSDVFRATVSKQSDVGDHPCPKPLSLMRQLIRRLRTKGSILDLFSGSGSTLVAAREMGRKAIGIEIEEKYCEIAAKRLGQGMLAFQ